MDRTLGRDQIKVVFDVGANVGQSALRYVQEFPLAEIYSFESVAATYGELVRGGPRRPETTPRSALGPAAAHTPVTSH